MNARLYDPVLHTFLSPDALIADPNNPQNYNRYGYALNNPLMYVDYSGNVVETAAIVTAVIIGAVIGGVSYVAINLYNGTAITWGGLTKSILVGAISGAATCGIGSVADSIFSNTAKGFFQGAVQGAVTGAITGTGGAFINAILNGDNPTLKAILQGALTGAVVGGIIGGIQGGIKANKAGLDFWRGTGTSDSTVGDFVVTSDSNEIEYSNKSAKTALLSVP
jgi:MFS family permease